MERKADKRAAGRITVFGDIAVVQLTKGKVAIIDAADAPWIGRWAWHTHISARGGKPYARRTKVVGGKKVKVYMHNEILPTPQGFVAHHADTDGLNNRRGNLEEISEIDNLAKAGKLAGATRKVRGSSHRRPMGPGSVRRHVSGRWVASLHIGMFETSEQAREAIELEFQKRKKAPASS